VIQAGYAMYFRFRPLSVMPVQAGIQTSLKATGPGTAIKRTSQFSRQGLRCRNYGHTDNSGL
jgi:hypothetical protein